MAKLVSLPEIIQDIYVKLEESGDDCSSNITIDASINKATLNISDGSVLSTQVLNVEDTPKAGRVTLTDKDSNSISFDAVTVEYLGKNFYTKSVVDDKLSALVLDSYDDTELKNRVTALENKVDNDTIYDNTELSNRVTTLENKISNMVTYADLISSSSQYLIDVSNNSDINQLLASKIKGSPTTTLTVDDLNFVETSREETFDENYDKLLIINYRTKINTEITFKDGSTSNVNIIFDKTTIENLGNEHIYIPLTNGVKIQRTDPNIPAYIDTGLKKNGNYCFNVKGCTTGGKVSVLVGSYDSNTDRTTLRILGTSNKIQSMWSANNEITSAESGIDFNSIFTYYQECNNISVHNSDNQHYDKQFTNQNTSQTTNTPIYLFNESTTSDYDHGVLDYVEIIEYIIREEYDSYTKYHRCFVPVKNQKTNEIVLIDASYSTDNNGVTEDFYIDDLRTGNIPEDRIYRPTNGILVEVQ